MKEALLAAGTTIAHYRILSHLGAGKKRKVSGGSEVGLATAILASRYQAGGGCLSVTSGGMEFGFEVEEGDLA